MALPRGGGRSSGAVQRFPSGAGGWACRRSKLPAGHGAVTAACSPLSGKRSLNDDPDPWQVSHGDSWECRSHFSQTVAEGDEALMLWSRGDGGLRGHGERPGALGGVGDVGWGLSTCRNRAGWAQGSPITSCPGRGACSRLWG